jgi:hypothetical protein
MTTVPVDTTEVVLNRHLQSFGSCDLDGTLADYADDAKLFSPFGLVKREGLADMFKSLFAEWGKPGTTFDLKYKEVDGDIGFIVWSAETPDNSYEFATDTFVIREGKIVSQTFAARITPKA